MDITHLSDVLDQVVKRLDQTQNLENKLDHMMKHLDTVQEKQVWLEDKFSEMSTRLEQVNAKLERCIEIRFEQVNTKLERCIETRLEQVNTKLERCIETRFEQVNTKLERCIETITRSNDTAKNDLLKHLTNSDVTQTQDGRKLKVEREQINASMASLVGHLCTIEKNMTAVVKKIESVESSLITATKHQDQLITHLRQSINEVKDNMKQSINGVKDNMKQSINGVKDDMKQSINGVKDDMKQSINRVKDDMKQSINEVKDDIDRSKLEIFAVTEKEAQIVRDRIEGPFPYQGKYTFDFYLENFKSLVRSDKYFYSLPWHINEMKSCVMGRVHQTNTGDMYVRLMNARRPLEVGLKPVSGVKLMVKATICDIHERLLNDVIVGEKIWDTDEADKSFITGWGRLLGVLSCDDLIQKGYGEKEGYRSGAVLIRYDVTVV